ncbi:MULTISPECIES: EamA family transporter [unclassified Archaeoglobus]|jgi:drug/metabolite transporter (DMT)-like permease|uniref:EamA family transporter n=1 Tax=unclassified Archaeoglobus TaxID=2643606 RepID=UPI0025BE269B|nr:MULTISPECIES: EamA family transporter [unclassified Archaeoglobus]
MRLGSAAVATSALLMSTVSIFVRNLEGDALTITFLRFSSALLIIAFLCLLNHEIPKIDRTLFSLAIFNLLTVVNYITAIQNLEVATAALLLYMAPVYVVPLSALMGEKVEVKTLIAVPLGIGGLYMILTPYAEINTGILFGIFSGVSYAFVFILSKEARKNHSPLQITFLNLGLGTIILLPYFFIFGTVSNIWWVIGLGTIPTAIPFTLFAYGVKYVKVQRAPILALLEPLSAFVIGYLYFEEIMVWKQLIGAAMILSSVFIAWRE